MAREEEEKKKKKKKKRAIASLFPLIYNDKKKKA
jgi:hypothetical protein